jgi:hypothetical protein
VNIIVEAIKYTVFSSRDGGSVSMCVFNTARVSPLQKLKGSDENNYSVSSEKYKKGKFLEALLA